MYKIGSQKQDLKDSCCSDGKIRARPISDVRNDPHRLWEWSSTH